MNGSLISDEYRKLNETLHEDREDYGMYGSQWAALVSALKETEGYESILDYGCGKGSLSKSLNFKVDEYDPAIPGKDTCDASDLVVCTDVLEHIEPNKLEGVIAHLFSLAKRKLFVCIATRPSTKFLADGRNAHLIIENGDWWRHQLEKRFQVASWEDDGQEIVAELIPLNAIEEIKHVTAVDNPTRNRQVKENIERVSKRIVSTDNKKKLPEHTRTAVLVCYGPSLKSTWPYIKMDSYREDHDVFTVSAAHKFLLDKNIIPHAHIDCDPRSHKGEQIGKPHKQVRYWLASCVHPSYLDKLEGHDVALWHSYNGVESIAPIVSSIKKGIEPVQRMIMGGGSVGLRAMSLLYYLGYRKFKIHGMDCSLSEGEVYAGEHLGKAKQSIKVNCNGRWFETSPVFILYARYYAKQLEYMKDADIYMFGDGMLQHMYQEQGEQNVA